jgi:hypothetical protein
VIAGNMQIGAGRRCGENRDQQQGERRDAHGSAGNRVGTWKHGKAGSLSAPDGTTLAGLCLKFVKHPRETKNLGSVTIFRHFIQVFGSGWEPQIA